MCTRMYKTNKWCSQYKFVHKTKQLKWNAIWTDFKSFLVYMYIINYNPLGPTGTWDRISPYTIGTTPSRQVMRIERNIF